MYVRKSLKHLIFWNGGSISLLAFFSKKNECILGMASNFQEKHIYL
jgi:hypothetical protein